MKKLIFALLLMVPFAVYAEPTFITEPEEARYTLDISILGTSPDLGGAGSETTQSLRGVPYETYTVAYTAMVDAIRKIITNAWVVTVDGLPTTQVQAILQDPQAFYCQ